MILFLVWTCVLQHFICKWEPWDAETEFLVEAPQPPQNVFIYSAVVSKSLKCQRKCRNGPTIRPVWYLFYLWIWRIIEPLIAHKSCTSLFIRRYKSDWSRRNRSQTEGCYGRMHEAHQRAIFITGRHCTRVSIMTIINNGERRTRKASWMGLNELAMFSACESFYLFCSSAGPDLKEQNDSLKKLSLQNRLMLARGGRRPVIL